MNLEEMKKKLEEMRLSQGEWSDTRPSSGKGHPIVNRQRERLVALKTLIESQIDLDMKGVVDLTEKLNKIRSRGR